MIEVKESGLTFNLDDDNCFRVEEHPVVRRKYGGSSQGNKACEFVTVVDGRHIFVEVKSSAPKGRTGYVRDLTLNGAPMPENWTAYDNYTTYLHDITKKFVDSYHLFRSVAEGNHGPCESLNLPEHKLERDRIEFVLIVNIPTEVRAAVKDSFANLKDALTNEMRPFLVMWGISTAAVKVFWPEQARDRYHFL